MTEIVRQAAKELVKLAEDEPFQTVLADPPWRFVNRTGKIAPEHRRLSRYQTMTTEDICELPVAAVTVEPAHLYLWVPNALLPDGLKVMEAWGFRYKANIVWHKIRKDQTAEAWASISVTLQNSSFLVRAERTPAPSRQRAAK